MPYASSLTDPEWAMPAPLLPQILPPKKQTRPPAWTKQAMLDGILKSIQRHTADWFLHTDLVRQAVHF